MPKAGDTLPWKIEFQYPDMPKYKRAFYSESDASRTGLDIARRGAEVSIYHVDPATGERTDHARYDADNLPPADEDEESE